MYYRIIDNSVYDFADIQYSKDCLYTDLLTAEEFQANPNLIIIKDGEVVLNPNYEAEQAQQEKERIGNLRLTGADVERGIYQAKGIDFDDIIAFVTANPPTWFDVKALKIELKANHFYRGNPYVSAVGALLGFTSEQLDKFFETNDYTCLLLVEVEDVSNTGDIIE